jgi:hypothetical protein
MPLKLTFIISLVVLSCTQNNGNRINNSLANTNYIYWEEMNNSQKDDIINSNEIYKQAIALYNGKMKVSDDKQSICLLDTLTSINKDFESTPFYFYLFNQICSTADGAVSEILGEYCLKIVLNLPDYVFNYFIKNVSISKKYAEYLGYEFYFKEDGTSTLEYNYAEFKNLLSNKIGNKKEYELVLKQFYDEIEKSMKNME